MAKNDEPKRKYNMWVDDNNEVKIIDMGYDWHTNVKSQAIVRLECKEND
ncbi:hypothetical protein ACTNDZ_12155 [Selenomonas montiformis]